MRIIDWNKPPSIKLPYKPEYHKSETNWEYLLDTDAHFRILLNTVHLDILLIEHIAFLHKHIQMERLGGELYFYLDSQKKVQKWYAFKR